MPSAEHEHDFSDQIDRHYDAQPEQIYRLTPERDVNYTSQAQVPIKSMTDRELAEEILYLLRRIDKKL
jgi:hypothetical protein